MQRCGVRPARGQVPAKRRHVHLWPPAAGRMAGVPRGMGFCDRQDSLLRRHGPHVRAVCRAGLRHACSRRRGDGADRHQSAGHHPDGIADAHPAGPCAGHPGLCCRGGHHRSTSCWSISCRCCVRGGCRQRLGHPSRRRPGVLRVCRVCTDCHPRRRGEGSGEGDPSGHPGRPRRGVCHLPGSGSAASGPPPVGTTGLIGGPASRSRDPLAAGCRRPLRAGRSCRRVPRSTAGAHYRGRAHGDGHGPGT